MKEKNVMVDSSQIHMRLIAREGNEEFLKTKPHVDFADLAVTFWVKDGEKAGMICGVNGENKEDEARVLLRMAQDNGIEEGGAIIETFQEIMKKSMEEMGGNSEDIIKNMGDIGKDMYILSTKRGVFGAEAVLFPDFPEKANRIFHGDFYMLPSSIHEWVLVGTEKNPDRIKEMVVNINRTEVDPKEKLSDSVYLFDMGEGLMRKVR